MLFRVMSKKWCPEEKRVITYIAGEFPTFALADIFKEAYGKYYSANIVWIEEV